MRSRAAVAHAAGWPLTVETVDVEGPGEGEALVEIRGTGVCHTDAYTQANMNGREHELYIISLPQRLYQS